MDLALGASKLNVDLEVINVKMKIIEEERARKNAVRAIKERRV